MYKRYDSSVPPWGWFVLEQSQIPHFLTGMEVKKSEVVQQPLMPIEASNDVKCRRITEGQLCGVELSL